jgi:hypothetical protein
MAATATRYYGAAPCRCIQPCGGSGERCQPMLGDRWCARRSIRALVGTGAGGATPASPAPTRAVIRARASAGSSGTWAHAGEIPAGSPTARPREHHATTHVRPRERRLQPPLEDCPGQCLPAWRSQPSLSPRATGPARRAERETSTLSRTPSPSRRGTSSHRCPVLPAAQDPRAMTNLPYDSPRAPAAARATPARARPRRGEHQGGGAHARQLTSLDPGRGWTGRGCWTIGGRRLGHRHLPSVELGCEYESWIVSLHAPLPNETFERLAPHPWRSRWTAAGSPAPAPDRLTGGGIPAAAPLGADPVRSEPSPQRRPAVGQRWRWGPVRLSSF